MQIVKSGLAVGVAALSLAAAGTPAFGAGHGGGKNHLAHTHLTLRATHEKVGQNGTFKASVVAKLRSHKAPLADEPVELFQRSGHGASWTDTGTGATTDASGTASFTFAQSATKQQYRVAFAGDSTYQKSHSGTITIHKLKGSSSTGS